MIQSPKKLVTKLDTSLGQIRQRFFFNGSGDELAGICGFEPFGQALEISSHILKFPVLIESMRGIIETIAFRDDLAAKSTNWTMVAAKDTAVRGSIAAKAAADGSASAFSEIQVRGR